MNEVATVEYNVIKNIETMTPEQLRPEINTLYHQTEAVGNIAVMMMAETGRMLLAVKSKVKHGEFESWCDENLDFSKSKAEKMMKLSEKMADENSIFSNPYTFTDLSISKVLTLIAAPEEVAAEVIESGDAEDMTVRELQEQIKTLKEEKEREVSDLQMKLDEVGGYTNSAQEVEDLKKKLEKEKDKNKSLKEKQAAAIDKAVAKANEEAKASIEEEVRKASEKIADSFKELKAENEKLTRQLDRSGNEDLVEFRIQSKAMQECFNACVQIIGRVSVNEKDTAKKMAEGLKKILEAKITNVDELTKGL